MRAIDAIRGVMMRWPRWMVLRLMHTSRKLGTSVLAPVQVRALSEYEFGHVVNEPAVVLLKLDGRVFAVSINEAETMADDLGITAAKCRKLAGLGS